MEYDYNFQRKCFILTSSSAALAKGAVSKISMEIKGVVVVGVNNLPYRVSAKHTTNGSKVVFISTLCVRQYLLYVTHNNDGTVVIVLFLT